MRPVSPRFIACERPLSDSRIVVFGVPFDEIAPLLEPGDAILVKGSRAVGLEGIPTLIEKLSQAW